VPTERVRNPWGVILHHEDDRILELRWLPATATMTIAGFKATLALLAHEAEHVRPPFVVIDSLQFHRAFTEDFTQWRDDTIVPRYGAASIRKFAFVVPAGAPNTMEAGGSETVDGPAIFPTAWFAERENALAWFQKE
jgi:hypothetical protein